MLNAAGLMVVIVLTQMALILMSLGVIWWQGAKLARQSQELRRAWRAAGFVSIAEYESQKRVDERETGRQTMNSKHNSQGGTKAPQPPKEQSYENIQQGFDHSSLHSFHRNSPLKHTCRAKPQTEG